MTKPDREQINAYAFNLGKALAKRKAEQINKEVKHGKRNEQRNS